MEPTEKRRARDSIFEDNSTDSQPYSFARRTRSDLPWRDPVPLFLSDPDSEPDPLEFTSPSMRMRRTGLATRILAVVLAISAVAALVAVSQSEVTRVLLANAKASIDAVTANRSAARPAPTQALAPQIPVNDPVRVPAPPVLAKTDANDLQSSAAPSREAIATAYQSALQNQAPAAAPEVAPIAAPPARTIDADTLATLMKRADSLMAVGDIAAARLLLERAANAQDATAAFLLAQTYDPAVLGPRDARSIVTDPAIARDWYQKAARLGSSEAQTRLTQLQN